MLYINGNTGTYTDIDAPKEADMNTPTPTTHTKVEFTVSTPTMYRFEVHAKVDGKVHFIKTKVTYREVVALRAVAHEIWGDMVVPEFDPCCPVCGYWMYTFGTTTLCMNDPECTYHQPAMTKADYTTAT